MGLSTDSLLSTYDYIVSSEIVVEYWGHSYIFVLCVSLVHLKNLLFCFLYKGLKLCVYCSSTLIVQYSGTCIAASENVRPLIGFSLIFCPKDLMSRAKPARDFSVMVWQYLSPKYWLMRLSVDGSLKSMWVLWPWISRPSLLLLYHKLF